MYRVGWIGVRRKYITHRESDTHSCVLSNTGLTLWSFFIFSFFFPSSHLLSNSRLHALWSWARRLQRTDPTWFQSSSIPNVWKGEKVWGGGEFGRNKATTWKVFCELIVRDDLNFFTLVWDSYLYLILSSSYSNSDHRKSCGAVILSCGGINGLHNSALSIMCII